MLQVSKLADNVTLLAVFTILNRLKCPGTYFLISFISFYRCIIQYKWNQPTVKTEMVS